MQKTKDTTQTWNWLRLGGLKGLEGEDIPAKLSVEIVAHSDRCHVASRRSRRVLSMVVDNYEHQDHSRAQDSRDERANWR